MSRGLRPIKAGLILLCALLSVAASLAQVLSSPTNHDRQETSARPVQPDLYSRIKHFDFDERKLGNYEDTPMHWVQLHGDGLPALFAHGQIDDEVGRSATPSFRLDIATGNVGYEYQHLDLTVIPGCDYSLVGYVRAEKLEFAGAFAAAYFVDRFGKPIDGSHRVSQIVRATGQDPEPWQRVTIDMPGDSPAAYALCLQFWILQDHAWRDVDPQEVDAIVRRDVYASAWFDDFSVYRLPRVNLRLSNPAGVVLAGDRGEIVLDVNNVTSQPLRMALTITDQASRTCHGARIEVPPAASPADWAPNKATVGNPSDRELTLAALEQRYSAAVREPLPDLAPGLYLAHLRVLDGAESLLTREVRFAVLPALSETHPRTLDLGVDLGPWRQGDHAGLVGLLTELGCGAVKIGVPMTGVIEGPEKTEYFRQLGTLVRTLTEKHIDTTGVILAPPTSDQAELDASTRALVTGNDAWHDLFGPVLAHLGALLPTWQLGAEETELRGAQLWRPDDVERVRDYLSTFVSIPRLAIPQPVTAVTSAGDDIVSVWVPSSLPTRTLPRLLDFLVSDNTSSYWLRLAAASEAGLNSTRQVDDLARRLVLAKSLNPGRIFLPAPLELSNRGGQARWQPTEDYLVYRTLFHYLAGKTAAAAMTPAPHTLAIVFQSPDSSCLVIWSWQDDPPAEPVELYLGPNPHAVTLWGQRQALDVQEGRARIPVGPTPLIVDSLNAPLALLQASYHVSPTRIQLDRPEPPPVVTFRNTFDTPLSGEIWLTPPIDWEVKPTQRSFVLSPGETFTETLTLTPPPHQIVQTHSLDVCLVLHTPEVAEIHFPALLTMDLPEIELDATVFWNGSDLILRQTLLNLSNEPVSFNAYCDPPGQARQERFFLSVAPGESALQTYVLPDARHLAGQRIPMGIDEIEGPRSLSRFAEVPQ